MQDGDAWHLLPSSGRGAPDRPRLTEDNVWALGRCTVCPIRARCLAEFTAKSPELRTSQIAGGVVWNGRGQPTRQWQGGNPLGNKSPGFKPVECGTASAAKRHRERGEHIDDECLQAVRAYDRERRRRQRARPAAEAPLPAVDQSPGRDVVGKVA
jgi:hypothetical protein